MKSSTGPVLDVTMQVQCAVQASTLYLKLGVSKFLLRGVFNPVHSNTHKQKTSAKRPRLCVRYLFRGKQHQVNVSDCEELKIPMRSHQLGDSQHFKVPRKKKKTRRQKHAVITREKILPVEKAQERIHSSAVGTSNGEAVGSFPANNMHRKIDTTKKYRSGPKDEISVGGGSSMAIALVIAAAVAVGVFLARRRK